jgi:hypothetical protein
MDTDIKDKNNVEKPAVERRRGKIETAYPEWSDYRGDC